MVQSNSFIERLGFSEEDEQSICIMTSSAFLGAIVGSILRANNPIEQKNNEDGLRLLGLCVGICIASSMGKPTLLKDIMLSNKLAEEGHKFTKFTMRHAIQPIQPQQR